VAEDKTNLSETKVEAEPDEMSTGQARTVRWLACLIHQT